MIWIDWSLYFLITILATMVGALTGIGGGVILKPMMDFLGAYDVETVGVLSSVAVFSMALVSVGRQAIGRAKIPYGTAIPLAIGSVAGGLLGQWLLGGAMALAAGDATVTVIQNVVLAVLMLGVFFYMHNNKKLKSHQMRGLSVSLLVGSFSGICASFLGIGGGSLIVALMVYLYSYDTKTATICSLVTLLFTQASRLTIVAATTGFAPFNLEMAPAMVVGAVAGGCIGTALNRRCREDTVEFAFKGVLLLVVVIAFINIAGSIA